MKMKTVVYRVQDKEGRGPFRPGFSQYWLDEDLGMRARLPTWGEEFGHDIVEKHYRKRHHYGSAVRSFDNICRWFSPSELLRLNLYGYSVVALDVDRILAESTVQVVIERKKPFHLNAQIIPLYQVVFGLMLPEAVGAAHDESTGVFAGMAVVDGTTMGADVSHGEYEPTEP